VKFSHRTVNMTEWCWSRRPPLDGRLTVLPSLSALGVSSLYKALSSLAGSANVTASAEHWDPYPFILMNLFLSLQEAYTAPSSW